MKSLLSVLNALPTEAQHDLALRCGTSVGYLRKACSTGQALGPALCVSIEREFNGAVSRRDLRPDDWQQIWPELAFESETV